MNRLDKTSATGNESGWIELVDQVNQMTKTIISVTPLTCHERILHNGSSGSLSSHLKNKVLELSKCKYLKKDTSGIRFLFQQWYRLVSEKSFE